MTTTTTPMTSFFDVPANKYTYDEVYALIKAEDLYSLPEMEWVEDLLKYWNTTQNHEGGMSLLETADHLFINHPSPEDTIGFPAGVFLGIHTELVI